jgi:ABC-2 type transport system permease protein
VEKYIPAPVRAIVVQDFYVLRRDVRNMSQLVMPLIFGLVYTVMFLRTGGAAPEGRGDAPPLFYEAFQSAMLYGNVAIAVFVSWFLLARLANVGFSQEGRSYWLVKTSPIKVQHLLLAKFLVAYLPSIGLALLFLIGISAVQGNGLALLWFTVPVVLLSVAGNAGLNLAFGVIGAKLDWEDPAQMNRGSGSCLGGLASMLFLPLILVLFFGPPIAAEVFHWPVLLAQLVGLFLGGLLGLAAAVLPLWLVRERVPRLGED